MVFINIKVISAVKWINNKSFKYKTIKDAESDKITLEVNPQIQYTPSLFFGGMSQLRPEKPLKLLS